jgi:hypothetical protein
VPDAGSLACGRPFEILEGSGFRFGPAPNSHYIQTWAILLADAPNLRTVLRAHNLQCTFQQNELSFPSPNRVLCVFKPAAITTQEVHHEQEYARGC